MEFTPKQIVEILTIAHAALIFIAFIPLFIMSFTHGMTANKAVGAFRALYILLFYLSVARLAFGDTSAWLNLALEVLIIGYTTWSLDNRRIRQLTAAVSAHRE